MNHSHHTQVIAALVIPVLCSAFTPNSGWTSCLFGITSGSRNNLVKSSKWIETPLGELQFEQTTSLRMSYVADSSDYSSEDSEIEDESANNDGEDYMGPGYREFQDVQAVEEKPIPMSKNAQKRFLVYYYDHDVDAHADVDGDGSGRDVWERHDLRQNLMEQHVLWARTANLYNHTFNNNSMADVVWSYPLLSADGTVMIGHALCIDSNTVEGAKELLSREPILMALTNELERDMDLSQVIFEIPAASADDKPHKGRYPRADLTKVGFYRWKHIRHYTLRQDDGMDDLAPTLIISFDHPSIPELRASTNTSHVEYLMDSEQVVMAGPFHAIMDDGVSQSATAIGDFVVVNTRDRAHAIEFAEQDPCARAGLYDLIRVHDFNNLDVTGKFVLNNKFQPNEFDQVKDAMDQWGYPVDDEQTVWLNQ